MTVTRDYTSQTPEGYADLLEACEAALRFFVEHERHAPRGPIPGAAKIKRQLREAIRTAVDQAREDL